MQMTAGSYLVLLALGNIAFCENTFEKVVEKAMCTLRCSEIQCQSNCIQNPPEIKIYNEKANADAVLVCRDVEFVVLAHNPGTFVIEHRLSENSNWSGAVEHNKSKVPLHNLFEKTAYQFRLHRVFEDGISRPEITEWIETMSATHEPLKVKNISLPRFELDTANPLQVRSEISFVPEEDRTCFYDVVCWAKNNQNILIELDRPVEFNMTFTDLQFDMKYWVVITAKTMREITSRDAMMNFTTPTCLYFHKNLTICRPASIDGLNATAVHKWENFYDVNVTWNMPELIPDRYDVWMSPLTADAEEPARQDVPGTTAETIFSNVKIVEQYDVHIRAASPGGMGPTIYRRFRVPLRLSQDPSVLSYVGIIAMSLLATVVLLVATGVYACHRHEKRKRTRRRLKYFKGLEDKEPALETIKDVGDREPIAIEKRLLTPVDEWEINEDRLELKRILGSGAFGIVKLGSLRDDRGHVTDVAVKMLRDDPNAEDLRSFELEMKIMKSVGQHPNIVSLLGCCTIGPRHLLIVEYCSKGDLQTFLRAILEKATVSVIGIEKQYESRPKSYGSNDTSVDNSHGSSSVSESDKDDVHISSFVANHAYDIDREAFRDTDVVTVTDLLNFGRQIATGMEFLSSNRVVHRDLAARNVLVCEDRTVKISDFGLSRDIYQENVYKKQGNGRVPVKWMAIEALTHQVYSTYSDVWSFGILLWEIVTLGSSPYPDTPANGVLKRLRSGYRMERPENCSVPLYNVMLSCWRTKPRDRPTFAMLRQELDKLICVAADHEYLDLRDASIETPPDDEETSKTSSSRYPAHFPLQLKYMNDRAPREIDGRSLHE